jgi:hypothetical protein
MSRSSEWKPRNLILDIEEYWRRIQRSRQLRCDYDAWLSEVRWRWVVTPTWRPGMGVKRAKRLFAEVIEMYESRGVPISFLRVTEVGELGKPHFHVLLTGPSYEVFELEAWWRKRAGICTVQRFLPRENGVSYYVKSIDCSGEYDIDVQIADCHRLSFPSASDASISEKAIPSVLPGKQSLSEPAIASSEKPTRLRRGLLSMMLPGARER